MNSSTHGQAALVSNGTSCCRPAVPAVFFAFRTALHSSSHRRCKLSPGQIILFTAVAVVGHLVLKAFEGSSYSQRLLSVLIDLKDLTSPVSAVAAPDDVASMSTALASSVAIGAAALEVKHLRMWPQGSLRTPYQDTGPAPGRQHRSPPGSCTNSLSWISHSCRYLSWISRISSRCFSWIIQISSNRFSWIICRCFIRISLVVSSVSYHLITRFILTRRLAAGPETAWLAQRDSPIISQS